MLSADEVASVNPLNLHMSSIEFGGMMVPNKEEDYILLLGNCMLYKEYYLTRFNHPKKTTHMGLFFTAKDTGVSQSCRCKIFRVAMQSCP